MNKIHYDKLKKSFERLKEQYQNYKLDKKDLTAIDKEGIKESVIKRFEICNDMLWKSLKRHLQEVESIAHISNSPNGVFRIAYESDIIEQKMLKRLMDYNTLRAMAAHDYSEEKANKTLLEIGNFIQDVEIIYKILEKGKWNKKK